MQSVASLIVLVGMLVTSGCVGVTGKPGTSGTTGVSIEVSPSNVNFGSLTVGQSVTKTLKITNDGTKSLSVSGISVAGTGFTMKAPALPLVLAAGQSASVSTTFTATASGSASGKIMISSNAPDSPMIVSLAATATGKSSNLAVTPASITFGDVKVGAESAQTVQLKNSGSTAITISSVTISGSGITVSGINTPATLAAGATANVSAVFKPSTAGNASGVLTVKSNASDASDAIGWSGTGTASSAGSSLAATPSSVAFGTVPTGTTTTQTIKLSNSGSASITISGISASGSGISVSGISTPLTLAAGKTANLTASLKPTSSGSASGAIKVTSNATDSSLQISWAANAQAATVSLLPQPAQLSFGSVTVGTTDTLQVTFKNTGNSDANVSKISVSGTGFALMGSASSVTLTPGQYLTLNVSYDPKATGNNSGSLVVTSNAAAPQTSVPLTGSGATKSSSSQHSVALAWDESSSAVVGYYIYRSSKPSGPYARVNSSSTPNTSYSDTTVADGQTYYYVVTAVNSSNIESTDSNVASATIPSN
ncbi:MAG TPA: choice-of-anchor D domain-containing protein [Candidatus Acidoferrales bacterium]